MVYEFPTDLKPRWIFKEILRLLNEDEILLLNGMRQVGKTSLLYLLIDYLQKKKGISKNRIVYFDLENITDFEDLEGLRDYNNFIKLLKDKYKVSLTDKIYVFIDEIQHLSNSSSFLKYIHEHWRQKIKFVVTGSSSLEIRKKFSDALTGRVLSFEIYPLDYKEFLDFREMTRSKETFEEYAIFGGFPAVSLKTNRETKIKLLGEIYSLYVKRDIKDLGKIADVLSFNNLVKILSSQTGGLVSETNLSEIAGVSRPTLRSYLSLLENTFVIDLMTPFFSNLGRETRKMPKLYFNDTGLRNAVMDNFLDLDRRTDKGVMIESAIYSEIKKAGGQVHFWRTETKQEIDFVLADRGKAVPMEVKYQSFRRPLAPINLRRFIEVYRPDRAYVLTRDYSGREKIGATEVIFEPCYRFNERKT